MIDSVATGAERMMKAKHFASDNIKEKLDKLHSELLHLKEQALDRKVKLQASLEAQKVQRVEFINCVCSLILYGMPNCIVAFFCRQLFRLQVDLSRN